MRTTNERLAEIQARVNAATEGPWRTREHDPDDRSDVLTAWHDPEDARGYWVICEHAGPDAEFIAHAREDVPWLLAELVRLRGRERDLEDALRGYHDLAPALAECANDCGEAVLYSDLHRANVAAVHVLRAVEPADDTGERCEFGCGYDDDPAYVRPGYVVVAGCPVHSREGVAAELEAASAVAAATPREAAPVSVPADDPALPCGHPFTAVVSGDEGTSYCGECAAADDTAEEATSNGD